VIAAAVLAALTVPDARGVATAIASIVPLGPAQLSDRCVHRSRGQWSGTWPVRPAGPAPRLYSWSRQSVLLVVRQVGAHECRSMRLRIDW